MLTYADICSASAASSNSALHLSQLNAQLNGAATTLAHDRARRLSRYILDIHTHCTHSNYFSSRPYPPPQQVHIHAHCARTHTAHIANYLSRPCPPPQQVHTRHKHALHTYAHCTHTHTAHPTHTFATAVSSCERAPAKNSCVFFYYSCFFFASSALT